MPDSWICEVVPRSNGTPDVYFYSPEGFKFRSDFEVYRHLGLPVNVCVAADKTQAQTRKIHTANNEWVGACSFLQIGLDAAQDETMPLFSTTQQLVLSAGCLDVGLLMSTAKHSFCSQKWPASHIKSLKGGCLCRLCRGKDQIPQRSPLRLQMGI